MTDTKIPSDRLQLFNVGGTFEIPTTEFHEKWWPLVSNVWTSYTRYENLTNKSMSIVYNCRLAKHRESSTRKDDIPPTKRRITSSRVPVECGARLRITHFEASQTTCIERFPSTPDHCHTIADNDMVKRPPSTARETEKKWMTHSDRFNS
ncbi:hypothetical protein BGX20_005791 [Mortierella sp. AD010]|nr:hypothetical protein BGX20_005791 [Mortierella sp. AD010]